jgi:hypothetical protein
MLIYDKICWNEGTSILGLLISSLEQMIDTELFYVLLLVSGVVPIGQAEILITIRMANQ